MLRGPFAKANYTRGDGDGGVNLLQRNAPRRCSAGMVFKGGLVAANGFRCMARGVCKFGRCKWIFGVENYGVCLVVSLGFLRVACWGCVWLGWI